MIISIWILWVFFKKLMTLLLVMIYRRVFDFPKIIHANTTLRSRRFAYLFQCYILFEHTWLCPILYLQWFVQFSLNTIFETFRLKKNIINLVRFSFLIHFFLNSPFKKEIYHDSYHRMGTVKKSFNENDLIALYDRNEHRYLPTT